MSLRGLKKPRSFVSSVNVDEVRPESSDVCDRVYARNHYLVEAGRADVYEEFVEALDLADLWDLLAVRIDFDTLQDSEPSEWQGLHKFIALFERDIGEC